MNKFLELDEIFFRRVTDSYRAKACVITDAQGNELMYAEGRPLPVKYQFLFVALFAAGFAVYKASALVGLLYILAVTVVIAYAAKKSEILVYDSRQAKNLLYKVTPAVSGFSFSEDMSVKDAAGAHIGGFESRSMLYRPLGGWKLKAGSMEASFDVVINLWKPRSRFVFVDSRTKNRLGSAGVAWNTRKATLDLSADAGRTLDRRLAACFILYAFNLS